MCAISFYHVISSYSVLLVHVHANRELEDFRSNWRKRTKKKRVAELRLAAISFDHRKVWSCTNATVCMQGPRHLWARRIKYELVAPKPGCGFECCTNYLHLVPDQTAKRTVHTSQVAHPLHPFISPTADNLNFARQCGFSCAMSAILGPYRAYFTSFVTCVTAVRARFGECRMCMDVHRASRVSFSFLLPPSQA